MSIKLLIKVPRKISRLPAMFHLHQ